MRKRVTRLVAVGLGAVVLGAMVGIAHVLWTRSADSEIVHYSWPVKWALTLASESPDLPPGSRFSTITVKSESDDERWTVAGEVELPSSEERRLVTSFAATVSSRCPEVVERRCWAIDAFSLGAVPAAMPIQASDIPTVERGMSVVAAVAPSDDGASVFVAEPNPSTTISVEESSLAAEEEDLGFILGEAPIEPLDDLAVSPSGTVTSPALPHDPILVRGIQRGLASLGYDPGPIDGIAGARTKAAVEQFRLQERLESGAIDQGLLAEIARRIEISQPVPMQVVPVEVQQPSELQEHRPACRAGYPKNRECAK